jgi:hypothetical protein
VATSGISIATNTVVVFRINQLTETAYGGITPTLPTTLQAENFDNGGEGIGFHSATKFNSGWVYRTDVGINIFPMPPTTNTFSAALAAGDWVQYTVNIPAGNYQVNARAAGSGAFTLSLNGTNLASFAPATGSTNVFVAISVPNVFLPGGTNQVLRITSTVAGYNLDSIQFVATPSFSGLNSLTNSYGATNMLLGGQISANGSTYPAIGDGVSAIINGFTVNGTVTDNIGDFQINYNDPSLATNGVSGSPYIITYQYAGNASLNLSGATNAGTSLTITPATPLLTLTASAITSGQTLASSSLSGSTATNVANNAAVTGGFAFADSTITPNPGSTNVPVIFTPQDLMNYNFATNTVNVIVNGITPITISGGVIAAGVGLLLTFNGPPGQNYEVLSSTNLSLPLDSWITNASGTFNFSAVTFTNSAPTDAQHFYRIKSP